METWLMFILLADATLDLLNDIELGFKIARLRKRVDELEEDVKNTLEYSSQQKD